MVLDEFWMKKHESVTKSVENPFLKCMEKFILLYFSVKCIFSPDFSENCILFHLRGIIFGIQKRKNGFKKKIVHTFPCNWHETIFLQYCAFFNLNLFKKSSFLYLTSSIQGKTVCRSERKNVVILPPLWRLEVAQSDQLKR